MRPTFDDIKQAAVRIQSYIHQTPVLTSTTLNQLTQATLFFKCESLQKIGAFKIRGATNAVLLLTEEQAQKGVATHSSGNHGAALALAAKNRGIPAYIVMPNNSTAVKKLAVAGYGANIIFCEPGTAARESTVKKVLEETGATFIHPYNNEHVIAGQGTVSLEFLNAIPELDILIVPIGGGGLIAGNAIAAKNISPQIQIIGAEPHAADDAYQSFKLKKLTPLNSPPQTLCDGLATTVVGDIPFPIILKNVDDILTAREETVLLALRYIWERMKIIVEPSAAVTLAIMLEHPDRFKHKRVGLILSGGNVDIKAITALWS